MRSLSLDPVAILLESRFFTTGRTQENDFLFFDLSCMKTGFHQSQSRSKPLKIERVKKSLQRFKLVLPPTETFRVLIQFPH